jgi:transcriptional regulator with XRE-family HTH domain
MTDPDWKKRLKDAIDADGRSASAISTSAGFTRSYISGIFNEGKDPSVEHFLGLCETLNVSPVFILTGRAPDPAAIATAANQAPVTVTPLATDDSSLFAARLAALEAEVKDLRELLEAEVKGPKELLDAEVKGLRELLVEVRGLRELMGEVKQSRDGWRGQVARLTKVLPNLRGGDEAPARRPWWRQLVR